MNSPAIKVLVAGPAGAGKTTFIRTLSTTPIIDTDVLTDDSTVGPSTTVALDFGTLMHAEATVHLFGTPGQQRFDFMWDILCAGSIGLVALVAGDRPSDLVPARRIIEHITSQIPIPWVLGVTRQDVGEVWTPDEVGMFFGLPADRIAGLDARDRTDALRLLALLFERIAMGDGLGEEQLSAAGDS